MRLLGVVSYEQREAQDAVRETGGLALVLGMCQINDANISASAGRRVCLAGGGGERDDG